MGPPTCVGGREGGGGGVRPFLFSTENSQIEVFSPNTQSCTLRRNLRLAKLGRNLKLTRPICRILDLFWKDHIFRTQSNLKKSTRFCLNVHESRFWDCCV